MSRLLLIEDDAETAEEVVGYFRHRGYDVALSTTGPDGLAAAATGWAEALIVTECCLAVTASPLLMRYGILGSECRPSC